MNAIVTLVAEQAIEHARKADEAQARGASLGPLHGLPIAHKDLVETAGIRTTFGSRIFKDYVPKHDAILVERIKKAGAICVGKTEHARIRRWIADLQRSIRRDEKSVRSHQDLRGQQRRRGRQPGIRHDPDRRWQR